MLSKAIASLAVALASSALVSAQTYSKCNPAEKSCPADPAFGKDQVDCDFTKGACDIFSPASATVLEYGPDGAVFKIISAKDSPTISSNKFIFYGRVETVVKSAPGVGVISSVVLQSHALDEIDWEWLGGDKLQTQSNYFRKGDTTTYDRAAFHPISNPSEQFNKYVIDWTPSAVTWSINGQIVRTLTRQAAKNGADFPQTPMQVKLGTWVAGVPGAAQGTIQWGGGLTDFSQAPFLAYYKSIKITDYGGKDAPTAESIKQYEYTDKSASSDSIKVVLGESLDTKKDLDVVSSSGSSSSSPGPDTTSASQTSSSETLDPKTSTESAAVSSESAGNATSTDATASVTIDASSVAGNTSSSETKATSDVQSSSMIPTRSRIFKTAVTPVVGGANTTRPGGQVSSIDPYLTAYRTDNPGAIETAISAARRFAATPAVSFMAILFMPLIARLLL